MERRKMADDEKGGFDPGPYEEEARQRWGHTDAYKESARRAKGYSKEDWTRIKAEIEDIETRLAALMKAGAPAEGEEAMAVAEEARLHTDRWFYPCSHSMHVAKADMFTTDPRFRAHYDERVEGLADYMAKAIRANAARETRGS